jgi:hypothetical protein
LRTLTFDPGLLLERCHQAIGGLLVLAAEEGYRLALAAALGGRPGGVAGPAAAGQQSAGRGRAGGPDEPVHRRGAPAPYRGMAGLHEAAPGWMEPCVVLELFIISLPWDHFSMI